jgi:putative protease
MPGPQRFAGEVLHCHNGMMTIDVKNRFAVGDMLELHYPGGSCRFRLDRLQRSNGESVREAPGSGYTMQIPVPERVGNMNLEFGLLTVDIS